VLQIIQLVKAHQEHRRLEALRTLSDDSGLDYDLLAEESRPSRVGSNGSPSPATGSWRTVALAVLGRWGERFATLLAQVGQKLSDLTTSRVVLLVLAMLFVLPVFNIGSGIYGSAPPLGSAAVKVSHHDVAARLASRACGHAD
jgi:hypothetical protein